MVIFTNDTNDVCNVDKNKIIDSSILAHFDAK